MDVTSIPFHAHLGLEVASPPHLLQLSPRDVHQNHLGTIHASVMIAVAEAGSGLFLQQHLEEDVARLGGRILPIIRRIDAKFHQAGTDKIIAKSMMDVAELPAFMEQLRARQRARITVPIQVVNGTGSSLLSISFDWFVKCKQDGSK